MPERAASGRSAQRRGQDAQRRLAAWLRDTGLYPAAEHVGTWPRSVGQGDVTGIGDRVAEITVQPWTELQAKLRQAEHDGHAQGFDEWFVWKPSKGQPPGKSTVTWHADVIFPLLVRYDRLEDDLADMRDQRDEALARAEESYHRGWEAGRATVNVLSKGGLL